MPDGAPMENRRQMLRTAARWAAGGGLAVLCAGLATREATLPAEPRGREPSVCRRCRLLADCRLPQAHGDCPDFRAAKMGPSPSGRTQGVSADDTD
jgi:hypothetical protein